MTHPQLETKLLPCPWCGPGAYIHDNGGIVFVKCRTCPAEGKRAVVSHFTHVGESSDIGKQRAINQAAHWWNSRRPSAVPPPDVVEAAWRMFCARAWGIVAADATHHAKEKSAFQAAIAAYIASQPKGDAWTVEDQPLPEDAEIQAMHPLEGGDDKTYAEAMRLVGAKRSKGALVLLVNWLLSRPAGPGLVALPEKMPDGFRVLVRRECWGGYLWDEAEAWSTLRKHFGSAPSTLVPLLFTLDLREEFGALCYQTRGWRDQSDYLIAWLNKRFSQPAAGAITKEERDVIEAAGALRDIYTQAHHYYKGAKRDLINAIDTMRNKRQ